MKTDGFEMANRRTARHAVQWQPAVEPKDDTRPMDFGDAVLVAGLTAMVFTLGVIVTVLATVLIG